jgi:tetratricopeptide (TPR) repeat protein
MLSYLLPGLREIRAPLISGYLWLLFLFLAFHDDLPHKHTVDPTLRPVFDLGGALSAVGIATVSGVAAYLIGSSIQELWKLLARLLPGKPVYGEAGTHMSGTGRQDVLRAFTTKREEIRRKLFQVAVTPGEKGVDSEPSLSEVEREMPLIRTLLLGQHPELIGELDRLQAEADLRIAVGMALLPLSVFLAFEVSRNWLLALIPALLLLLQGYQRQLDAGDLLAKAMRIGRVSSPSLEALDLSADAAVERIDLEDVLRKRKEEERSPMAAFRLGNLQATGENVEGAIQSLRFAADNGVVQAYAEVGLVFERKPDLESAEQAFRDGHERGDKKALDCLQRFLSEQGRDEEALKLARGAGPLVPRVSEDERRRRALSEMRERSAYRRRMEEGDPKAAINLGLQLERGKRHAEAIEAFRRATELDPADAEGWQLLAGAQRELSDFDAAVASYEKALAVQRKALGDEHLEVAFTMVNLGTTLNDIREFGRALELLEAALPIIERELPPGHINVAVALGDMGNTLASLGRPADAAVLQQRAVAIEETAKGPEDVTVAITKGNFANTLQVLDDYPRALELQVPAFEIVAAELGEGDARTAIFRANIGNSYAGLGEYGRALELQQKALATVEKDLEAVHPIAVSVRNDLVRTLNELGRYGEAKLLAESSLQAVEGRLGPEHSEVAEPLLLLGAALRGLGENDEAAGAQERAATVRERDFGVDHPLAARARTELGRTEMARGNEAEAARLLERALPVWRASLSDASPRLAEVLAWLGSAFAGKGDREQGASLLAEALEVAKAAEPRHLPVLGLVQRRSAQVQLGFGKAEEAEALAAAAVAAQEEAFGPQHPELAQSLSVLASALAAVGRTEEAAEAAKRAHEAAGGA